MKNPLPFSELQAQATLNGPFKWTYDGSSDFTIGSADSPQDVPGFCIWQWQKNGPDRVELICRLLNWTSVGGFDSLTNAKEELEWALGRLGINPQHNNAYKYLVNTLATLNGKNP